MTINKIENNKISLKDNNKKNISDCNNTKRKNNYKLYTVENIKLESHKKQYKKEQPCTNNIINNLNNNKLQNKIINNIIQDNELFSNDFNKDQINSDCKTVQISNKQLKSLEDLLKYKFCNRELLRNALRHSSIKKSAIFFERLEFLGDRILGVVIAEYIYRNTTGNEGGMAKMHSAFVCADSCYEVAIKLGVNNIIQTAGPALHNNKTVLADAMEAILGAIFTDSKRDYKILENIITRLWKPIFKKYKEEDQEPKTKLQEIVQAVTNEVPLYTLLSETGPKHHPIFTVSVTALGNTVQASGFSKKEAETKAARELLNILNKQ